MLTKTDLRTTDTKERILKEALRLYQVGGYNYMGLEKIGKTLNITRPALYHHFPGGKEELLIAIVESFTNAQAAHWQAAIQAAPDAHSRFSFILKSITNLPLLDTKRMICVEMEQLGDKTRAVIQESFEQLRSLVLQVFQEGVERGELRPVDLDLAFFSFVSLCDQVERVIFMHEQFPQTICFTGSHEALIENLLDLWLNGLASHPIDVSK